MVRPRAGPTIGGWAIAEDLSEWIEIAAVVTIALAVLLAALVGVRVVLRDGPEAAVSSVKRDLGRGLLLGLDLLIAADIIKTVTLELTVENVGALGLLVAVRTFLAWALVVELSGRWPWQLQSDLDDPTEHP